MFGKPRRKGKESSQPLSGVNAAKAREAQSMKAVEWLIVVTCSAVGAISILISKRSTSKASTKSWLNSTVLMLIWRVDTK